jgi:hypothetical protein
MLLGFGRQPSSQQRIGKHGILHRKRLRAPLSGHTGHAQSPIKLLHGLAAA